MIIRGKVLIKILKQKYQNKPFEIGVKYSNEKIKHVNKSEKKSQNIWK